MQNPVILSDPRYFRVRLIQIFELHFLSINIYLRDVIIIQFSIITIYFLTRGNSFTSSLSNTLFFKIISQESSDVDMGIQKIRRINAKFRALRDNNYNRLARDFFCQKIRTYM